MINLRYIKSNINHFKKDKFSVFVCILSVIIGGFHTWQFIASDYNYNCFIRLIFFYSVIPGTILFGRKAVYVMLVLFSLGVSYVNTFNNYTGLFCILMSCRMIGRNRGILLVIYALNEFIALNVQGASATHYAIHYTSCLFWYILYFCVHCSKIELDLTDDEIIILDELIAGKQQKEIDFFNKNTVTKKLAEARKRNKCKTTNELLFKYRRTLEKRRF